MRINPLIATSVLVIRGAASSRPSTIDRSTALLKNRPAGDYRLLDIKHERNLQSYSTIDGFSCFRDLEGMTQAMFDLEASHPDLVSIESIGESYLKTIGDADGHDIYVMKITASDSPDPAQIFFTGGHHARELAPPELLMRFAEHLVEGYDTNADITWVLDTTQVNIVLYVNPDGRIIAETQQDLFWRKNVNSNDGRCPDDSIGTDLNRNYDWMWGDTSGASSNPCDEDYHGIGPASEPEVQAVIAYAKSLFPEEQRKDDPVKDMEIPFGEDITGVYMDIHSYGGLTYYPWGFENKVSPDNDSLEALGRKVSFFNGYVLWAGGQPDFLYPATGDASDYMYAHLGVASLGLEIGDDFYQDCDGFEKKVYPDNLNTLMYTIKLAKKPNAVIKGPDVLDMTVTEEEGKITVSVDASDSELVNIDGYDSFATGEQTVSKIELYLDVYPDDFGEDDTLYVLQPLPVFGSDRVSAETDISTSGLITGRHVFYAVATDSDGYSGPISSVFFEVENVITSSPVQPTSMPTILVQTTTTSFTTTTTDIVTDPPSQKPIISTVEPTVTETMSAPSKKPSIAPVTAKPISGAPSSNPTTTSTLMTTSDPTLPLTSEDPSVDPSTSAPTVVKTTMAPSITSKSESPTLSEGPSVGTLGNDQSEADLNRNTPENAAITAMFSFAAPLVLCLFTYLFQ